MIKFSLLIFYGEDIITATTIGPTISTGSETGRGQEHYRSAVEAIQAAIGTDDRIGSDQQLISPIKPRMREIIEIIGTQGAHCSPQTSDLESMGISAPELATREDFDVGIDTLRSDLRTPVECGYLDADASDRPYQYMLADSWITRTATDVDPDRSSPPSQDLAIDRGTTTHETAHAEPGEPIKNHQRVFILVSAAQANLTSTQQTVASVFGTVGCVVGLLGVILGVSGLYLDPDLVAAGDSSIRAGLTLLLGWFWLHFDGLVTAVSGDEEVTLS